MALALATIRRSAHPEARLLFSSDLVRIGAFRCAVDDPGFATAGSIGHPHFVFPRTPVWIQHEGGRPFAADPGLVTLYNPGQPFRRAPLSAEGDNSDWFEVSRQLVGDVAASLGSPLEADPERPFRAAWIPGSARLYWRQRQLFERLGAGEAVPALEAEETAAGLLAAVLTQSFSSHPRATPPAPSAPGRMRDLAQAARAELDLRFPEALSLATLASRLRASPFALCRAFRAAFGTTLHAHLLQVRLCAALESLAEGEPDLTGLALDLGFSSHSHFTLCFRRSFGVTPSAARARLRSGGRPSLERLRRQRGRRADPARN